MSQKIKIMLVAKCFCERRFFASVYGTRQTPSLADSITCGRAILLMRLAGRNLKFLLTYFTYQLNFHISNIQQLNRNSQATFLSGDFRSILDVPHIEDMRWHEEQIKWRNGIIKVA
jgi:hypothetical protein